MPFGLCGALADSACVAVSGSVREEGGMEYQARPAAVLCRIQCSPCCCAQGLGAGLQVSKCRHSPMQAVLHSRTSSFHAGISILQAD